MKNTDQKITNPLSFGLRIVNSTKEAAQAIVGQEKSEAPHKETPFRGQWIPTPTIHRSQKKKRLLARRAGRVS